jgi:hypothetical protein
MADRPHFDKKKSGNYIIPSSAQRVLDDRLQRRMQNLIEALNDDTVSQVDFGPLVFLRSLLNDRLQGLRFDPNQVPTPQTKDGRPPSMEISDRPNDCYYRVNQRTRDAMRRVQTDYSRDECAVDWMIDNYFIHELFHFAQGMGGGRHSGIGDEAPLVLLAIDYQADALAAVTQFILAWCCPKLFGVDNPAESENHWTLYQKAIGSILDQMEIFTLLTLDNMDRTEIGKRPWGYARILRIATWHYQSHRASKFNPDRPVADFQILMQPHLDFRNLAQAARYDELQSKEKKKGKKRLLTRNWPANEKRLLRDPTTSKNHGFYAVNGRNALIITGVTPSGTTAFIRHAHGQELYERAFQAFFDHYLPGSERFFTSLFEDPNSWLIGKQDPPSPPNVGGDGDGGPDTPSPQPLSDGTRGLALVKDKTERLDLLRRMMKSSLHPLTTMEIVLAGE